MWLYRLERALQGCLEVLLCSAPHSRTHTTRADFSEDMQRNEEGSVMTVFVIGHKESDGDEESSWFKAAKDKVITLFWAEQIYLVTLKEPLQMSCGDLDSNV